MSNKDQNEKSEDASGVTDSIETAPKPLAKSDTDNQTSSNNHSKPLPNLSHNLLGNQKRSADRLEQSIALANERNLSIVASAPDRDSLLNEIMSRMEDKYVGRGADIPEDDVHEIGMNLIQNYACIELSAGQLGLSPARLRFLVRNNDILSAYFEIAHEGIKSLTDKRLIQGLKDNDPNIVRLIATRLYAGRSKGGYNIAEIGTTGYKDKLSKQLAAETESDRKQGNVHVEFNFVKKEIRAHSSIESTSDILDAEFEDVEDDSKQ